MPLDVSTTVPDPADRESIRTLAADVEAADGAPPLSDQALSALAGVDVAHTSVHEGDRLVGYAQRAGESLEVVGAREALDALLDASVVPGALVWSHGQHSRLVPLFERRGFARSRELHQLRLPLDGAHPVPDDPALSDGIRVRAFRPGDDDATWLAVNAAAFATHPEQGRWGHDDLQARIDADWFDPAGFLLAEREGDLLGYHWTKVHPDGAGEVYVLGVSPRAQGLGLGRALLVRGLHHLAARGCPYVLLYVDGDNPGALRLYERAGFARHDLDIQWSVPA